MGLLKKITGSIILFSIAFKMLMVPIFFANYELRKTYIIKNFCINKNRPEMNCDGKCYLAKQLKKAEQGNEKQATNSFISRLISFESEFKTNLFSDFFLKKSFLPKENSNFKVLELLSSKSIFSFFHPPQTNG